MNRVRQALVVYVDLDPSPGAMHTKESARNVVDGVLQRTLKNYHPMVSIAPSDIQNAAEGNN